MTTSVKKLTAGEPGILRYAPLLVILVPFIIYISSIRLGFVYFDDDILVLDNFEKISNFKNIGLAFRSDAFFSNLSPYYRPLMNVSFMVDAVLGGTSPGIYHFGNLVCHLVSCLSLYWLLTLLGFARKKALAGALIFAVHPMIGHAVLWIPARGDLLVTMFGLLSFAFFIRYLEDRRPERLAFHGVFLAGAFFSKESAILFPVLCLLYIVITRKKVFDRRWLFVYAIWALILVSWFWLRHAYIDQRGDEQRGLPSLIMNLPFLPEAVSRFFFPFMLPVTPVFSTGYTLSGIIAIVLILVWIIRTRAVAMMPMVILGSVWFLGFCLPNMFVRLVSAGDNFEYLMHRTYLPYIGFLMMMLAMMPDKWVDLKTRPFNVILAALIVLLSAASFFQQGKFMNAENYWGSAIRYAPGKAWFHYYMSRYYFKQKDYDRLEYYLKRADSIKSYPEFKYHMGMVAFLGKKDYDKAYACFSEALTKGYGGPEQTANFVNLCIESSSDLFQRGSYDRAIARCEEALLNDPDNGVAAYNLGIYLINTGEKQRAAAMWKRAVRNKPDLTEAYRSLCLYYHYEAKKADSAAWYAREYKNHGGTGDLISP